MSFTGNEITANRTVIDSTDYDNLESGNITFSANDIHFNKTYIYAQENGGSLNITGNDVKLTNGAYINVNTTEKTGNDVTIKANNTIELSGVSDDGYVTEIYVSTHGNGDAGTLTMEAGNVKITDGAWISSSTYGTGKGGNINIRTSNFTSAGEFDGLSGGLYSSVFADGHGGDINIEADNIELSGGAYINSNTYGPGDAGDININAESITLFGATTAGRASSIVSGTSPKEEFTMTGGNGGNIFIDTSNLTLLDGGLVASSAIADDGFICGEAGKISINADSIFASGVNPHGPNEDGYGSGIYARSFGAGADDAGRIEIDAGQVNLSEGGIISTESTHKGGGVIRLKASDQLHLHNGNITTSVAQGEGQGGVQSLLCECCLQSKL
ncbi:MAG: hypothetical protein GY749_43945 [Desulfobacteraceae bacterium]|nr:hypothetical protein [Desulfobacteraceae bacterium]